jgi:hypothetical protein
MVDHDSSHEALFERSLPTPANIAGGLSATRFSAKLNR